MSPIKVEIRSGNGEPLSLTEQTQLQIVKHINASTIASLPQDIIEQLICLSFKQGSFTEKQLELFLNSPNIQDLQLKTSIPSQEKFLPTITDSWMQLISKFPHIQSISIHSLVMN